MAGTLPPRGLSYLARAGVVEGALVEDVRIDVDGKGEILRVGPRAALPPPEGLVHDLGAVLVVPGFVNAHSHAFQRAIRGATHRRAEKDPSSFWSWREAMYEVANAVDPEQVYAITRRCFSEMLASGITCVGEFHYLHHRPDGQPYDDPNELSWQVVHAAADVGIKLVLLEVFYARSGHGRPPLPEQRRFCDASVDAYLGRVDALRARGVQVGIAPHSVRAAGADALRELAAYAHAHDLPIHVHVSEQPRENEECAAEHGKTPVQVLADAGAMAHARQLTAVHAIHLQEDDRRLLADQIVCACPTTEADLGDGVVAASELAARGTTLALGSDSNAVIDLVQEARLLEMHERLVTGARLRLNDPDGRLGSPLLRAATEGGAIALGCARRLGQLGPGRPLDAAVIALDDLFFDGVALSDALDALFTSGTAASVRQVLVDGTRIV